MASLRVLLKEGADVTTRDAMGRTPLLVAAQENKIDAMNMLLAAGCSVNNCDMHNRSVLYWAVYHNNQKQVEEVLSGGCSTVLDHQGPYGVTPLILAAYTGNLTILQLIIDAGADPNICEDNGMTAVVVAARHDQFSCVRRLIAAGCDVNTRDAYGKTLLMLLLDHDELVRMLLDAGADPNHSADNQMTCLWLATYHKFAISTKLLLQYNARVDTLSGTDSNKLPLQTAIYGGCLSLVKVLFITSIAMATDLTWLCEYMKDDNFRDQAAEHPDVAAAAVWISDVMDDFYKPREPATLKAFCRIHIRRHLGSKRLWSLVNSLVLPGALKNFLKLQELDQYIS
jgi:ankyrin